MAKKKKKPMTVLNLLRQPRELEIRNNYDERSVTFYEGGVAMKRKGVEKFQNALQLRWWFFGSDVVIVECRTRADADELVELIESIEGDCYEEEWNAWFKEV